MPAYACHTSVSCHVSPEAKLRMLYLLDLTRHRKGMKEWFTAAPRGGGKREGKCKYFQKSCLNYHMALLFWHVWILLGSTLITLVDMHNSVMI